MRQKVDPGKDQERVVYDSSRWALLGSLRTRAREVQEALDMQCHVYGSVARGDVKASSDIDIVILDWTRSYLVELALDKAGFDPIGREMVKANPNSVPKAHIYIDSQTTVSFFLGPSTISEEEFYMFGGLVDARDGHRRVPGVDKRLVLIIPTQDGHIEWGIAGREPEVAARLGVGTKVVEERARVLARRDQIGRTGVYLRKELHEGEGFEEVLKQIMDRDHLTRRQLRGG